MSCSSLTTVGFALANAHEHSDNFVWDFCILADIFVLICNYKTHNLFSCFVQKVLQRTPIRVLHRRSPLEREKIIHWYDYILTVLCQAHN